MTATMTLERTWVKFYDQYNRLVEDFAQPSIDSAREKYGRLLSDPSIRFAQWGVSSNEGSIVLGEYRDPTF